MEAGEANNPKTIAPIRQASPARWGFFMVAHYSEESAAALAVLQIG
jgi:hypothetical protein